MDKVAVIIPIYKDKLTDYEEIALRQCFKILNEYPIIVVKPQSLNISSVGDFSRIISFEDQFFLDIKGYNELMLSEAFYKKFLNYEYILIYQLDAFVFRDELNKWCDLKYDYIGAPWLRKKEYTSSFKKSIAALRSKIHIYFNLKQRNSNMPTLRQFENRVGNGGLSLRKVSKFYELSMSFKDTIAHYNKITEHYFNEDVFWSIEVNRKRQLLKIPDYKEALTFAFENNPQAAIQINKSRLPFGCHAWDRHIDFWRPIFKKKGYII